MKKVTFTAQCAGIGAVYNKGDIAVFPDEIADAIVSAKKGTAEDLPAKTSPPAKQTGGKEDKPTDTDPEDPGGNDKKSDVSDGAAS